MERFNSALKALSPFAFTMMFAILSFSPLKGEIYGLIFPNLALPGIFLWSLWRPHLMPVWGCFCIGLTTDLIAGVTLGTFALTYVLLQILLGWRSLFSEPFELNRQWFVFTFFSVLCSAIVWCLVYFTSNVFSPLSIILMHTLLTAAAFPLLYFVNQLILNAFLTDK